MKDLESFVRTPIGQIAPHRTVLAEGCKERLDSLSKTASLHEKIMQY